MIRRMGFFITACMLTLAVACGSPAGKTGSKTPTHESPPESENSVEIVSALPSPQQGLSTSDTQVTLTVHSILKGSNGLVSVWWERFSDAACTVLSPNSSGNTTYPGSVLQSVSAGDQQLPLTLPVPMLDTPYVGLGIRIWSADSTFELVGNPGYLCYKVNQSPASTNNWAGIIASTPTLEQGFSIHDTQITLVVHYILVGMDGSLQIWFERFQDANCTVLGRDPSGNSTMAGGAFQNITAGQQDINLTFALPLLDTDYVGIGVSIWATDGVTKLYMNPNYICFRVNK